MFLRNWHVFRLDIPVKFVLDKFNLDQRTSERLLQMIILLMFTIIFAHLCACIWIVLGMLDADLPEEERRSWLYNPEYNLPDVQGNERIIYITSYYTVFTTITTVGYGDFVGGTSLEYAFSMVLEFFGLSFFSLVSGVTAGFFQQTKNFDSFLASKNDQIDMWIKRIEKSNPGEHLPPMLYYKITTYIREAFLFDFNLIIEEFTLYQKLTPKMQNELVEQIFTDFIVKFDNFFGPCEIGFRNEMIINMYIRIYKTGVTVVDAGRKFLELYFIQ